MSQVGSLTQVWCCGFLNVSCAWGSLSCFLGSVGLQCLSNLRKFWPLFFHVSFSMLPLRTPVPFMLDHLKLPHSLRMLCSFICLFPLCFVLVVFCCSVFIFTTLSSTVFNLSLILFNVIFHLTWCSLHLQKSNSYHIYSFHLST